MKNLKQKIIGINFGLAIIASFLNFEFGAYFLIPFTFLGFPTLLLKGSNLKKMKLSALSVVATGVVLFISFGASATFGFIAIPMLIIGLAGYLVLLIHTLLIDEIKSNFSLSILTFFFSTIPMFLLDSFGSFFNRFLRWEILFPIFWLSIVSVCISFGIQKDKKLLRF